MTDPIMKGIDVSAYQTNVDYNQVKKAGYNFVIIRDGWGKELNQKDSQFETHYANATKAGLYVGAYHYSYALTDPNCKMSAREQGIAEAKTCYEFIKGHQFSIPIWYDVEEQAALNHSKNELDQLVHAFCETMESYGYYCGIYGGQYLFENKLYSETTKRFALWYAQYLLNPRYKGEYGMWQFGIAGASAGNNPAGVPKIPGINGECDVNYCYFDYPTTIKDLGLNGYGTIAPTPSTPKFPDIPVLKEYKQRLTIPQAGNKYYNSTKNGGYAVGLIDGNPQQAGLDVLANCVAFSACRFNEILGLNKWKFFSYAPNAELFIQKANEEGLEISQTPSLGAVIVWAKGKVGNSADGAGHVAIVEQVNQDGSIITSESGYGCSNPFWTSKRYNGDGRWGAGGAYTFLGFIKNPAVDANTVIGGQIEDPVTPSNTGNPYKEPTNLIKEGSTGDGVKWVQYELTRKKYFNDEIDGDFQVITLGAVLAFQKKNGLTVDGIVGQATRNALKK